MPEEFKQDPHILEQKVKASLLNAEKVLSGLKKIRTNLFITGILSSGASTLVAGITAAQGPLVGNGTDGWRLACIIAAIFGFISTLVSGLSQHLNIQDRLTEGTHCVGKLRSLDMILATGSRSREEIVREFEEVVKSYPAMIS